MAIFLSYSCFASFSIFAKFLSLATNGLRGNQLFRYSHRSSQCSHTIQTIRFHHPEWSKSIETTTYIPNKKLSSIFLRDYTCIKWSEKKRKKWKKTTTEKNAIKMEQKQWNTAAAATTTITFCVRIESTLSTTLSKIWIYKKSNNAHQIHFHEIFW